MSAGLQARGWPRQLQITRTGRTYLVLTVGVGLGALNTGNNLLYLVLGLMLSLIVVSGVWSERFLRRLEVMRLAAGPAFSGERCAVRWSLRCDVWAYALTVAEESSGWTGEGRLLFLSPGQARVAEAQVTAPARGPHRLSAVRVTTTYPFGLFAKSRRFALEEEVLVFPRRVQPRKAAPPVVDLSTGEAGDPGRGEGEGDVYGLTEYRPGDDARRIHWKKSAARGAWVRLVREREQRPSVTLAVPQDVRGPALDRACEEIAAQAASLLRQGTEVGLEVGGTRLRPAAGSAQQHRILRALAWAGFAPGRA